MADPVVEQRKPEDEKPNPPPSEPDLVPNLAKSIFEDDDSAEDVSPYPEIKQMIQDNADDVLP
jgi:hypothetical protein